MEDLSTDVCIVGAGAAGLWAAAACARRGAETLVLEKNGKTGTKVLSSGGSRCNLTTALGPREAARFFGHAKHFITPAIKTLSPQAVRRHFEGLGVATKEEPLFEKIFPRSNSALEVRNALESDAKSAGARFLLDNAVLKLRPHGEGGWRVCTSKVRVTARRLLLCPGGKSYPKSGTTGDGYVWLKELGLKLVQPVPALVPLVSNARWIHALSGVSIDGELRIGKTRRRRPVLFTHRGLSGPGAMDLSELVTRGGAREARLDLLPDTSHEDLRQLILDAAGRPGAPRLTSILPLPKRVLAMVANRANLSEDNPRMNEIKKAGRHRLIESLKGLQIPIAGTLGFAKAEVTAGGLDLKEVDRMTMGVKRLPGLFAFGELLDLHGPIGGFNFQSAFSTAEMASRAASQHK